MNSSVKGMRNVTSRLNLQDFEDKLHNVVTIGDPSIMGTPLAANALFKNSEKKFYGSFDDRSFQLTKNISLISPIAIPYILKGIYSVEKDSTTKISYEVKPIWFGYLWIRLLPLILLILINILFIRNSEPLPLSLFIVANSFIVCMFLTLFFVISV